MTGYSSPSKAKSRRKGDAKPKKDEIDPFSAEERTAIFEAAKGQERNFIQFAFWTGLRISELCALDWDDVDWVNKRIFVQRALTQHSKEPETPKTAAGERYVKLLPAALEALKAQKAFTFMEGNEIFRNPNTDKRWTGDMVIRQRMWKRVLLRVGVRYRYPYQMRHTYCLRSRREAEKNGSSATRWRAGAATCSWATSKMCRFSWTVRKPADLVMSSGYECNHRQCMKEMVTVTKARAPAPCGRTGLVRA